MPLRWNVPIACEAMIVGVEANSSASGSSAIGQVSSLKTRKKRLAKSAFARGSESAHARSVGGGATAARGARVFCVFDSLGGKNLSPSARRVAFEINPEVLRRRQEGGGR
jgi:hypothetical protein